jgi:hypothetical protein
MSRQTIVTVCLMSCLALAVGGCGPGSSNGAAQSVPAASKAEQEIANCLRDIRDKWRAEVEVVESTQREIDKEKRAYNILRFRQKLAADFQQCQWCVSKVNGLEQYLEPIKAEIEECKKVDAQLLECLEKLKTSEDFNADSNGAIAKARALVTDNEFNRLVSEGPKMIPWDQKDPDKFMSLK